MGKDSQMEERDGDHFVKGVSATSYMLAVFLRSGERQMNACAFESRKPTNADSERVGTAGEMGCGRW